MTVSLILTLILKLESESDFKNIKELQTRGFYSSAANIFFSFQSWERVRCFDQGHIFVL
jgi:hypothetical protein